MNNLQTSSRAHLKVLSEGELTRVVGGNGHHRKWRSGHDERRQSKNNREDKRRGAPQITIINNFITNNFF